MIRLTFTTAAQAGIQSVGQISAFFNYPEDRIASTWVPAIVIKFFVSAPSDDSACATMHAANFKGGDTILLKPTVACAGMM